MYLLFFILAIVTSPFRCGPLVVTSSSALAHSPQLSILSATVNSHLTTSTINHWNVPPSLSPAVHKRNTQNISCEVTVIAVLKEQLKHEYIWGSGLGALSFQDKKGGEPPLPTPLECVFMTITGAEVWHQTDIPNTLNVAATCTSYRHDHAAQDTDMCSRLQPHNPSQQGPLQQRRTNTNTNFVSPLPSLILTLFPSPPALSPSPDVSPSSSSSSSLSTSSSSRRVAPSLLHHSFALEHTIANINHWDPPNLHYLLPNHTRGTLPPPPSPPVAVSAHFPLPPKTLSAKSQTDTDTDTDHTDADTNTRPEGGWGGSKLGPRKPDAVCVTQTFRNEQSGPMLYMFVQHYHSLGWEVLIYDRFGFHQEYLQDFLAVAGVHYHPYTAYQLLYPDTYHEQFAKKQSHAFRFYSERGYRGFGKGAKEQLLQDNEESDHDSDRRKTFLLARQQYSAQYFMMLYPDRDEFLYCSGQNVRFHQESNSNHTAQKLTQHRHFRMLYRRTKAQSIALSRIAHSARYPAPPPTPLASLAAPLAHSSQPHTLFAEGKALASAPTLSRHEEVAFHRDSNIQVDIQAHLSACLKEGYEKRSMRHLWHCFSEASMENTKTKSGDVLLSDKCPFVGVHETCLRCKCIKAKSKKCHYLHLNTVYFKPHKIYEKYGKAMYAPLADMVNLWNEAD